MTVKSINRNIMECKGRKAHNRRDAENVLIETLWNVKYILSKSAGSPVEVLIETLWNVKKDFTSSFHCWLRY